MDSYESILKFKEHWDELLAMYYEALDEIGRLRWLMSMRVDGDHTLLETYEMHDREFIDRMRGKNA